MLDDRDARLNAIGDKLWLMHDRDQAPTDTVALAVLIK
jgi:hypothetical protein